MPGEDPKLVVSLEARINAFERQLAKATKTADRNFTQIETRAASMSSKLGGIGRAAFGGFAAGALAALAPMALFSKALETINDASHIVDTADKIGITTTALQELTFGFSQAGVEANAFETGMEQFSKRIGEAATKGGDLAKILKANGVAIRDSNGQIRSSSDLLPEYADLVKNAASEQEKMLLVTEAFGRGGGDMLNGLNQGAEGIRNMKKAAEDAGGVIEEELLRRSEEFGDRWEAAWRRFTVNSQSAILTAIDGMASLNQMLLDFEKRKAAADIGTLAGSMVGKPGEPVTIGTRDKPTAADAALSDRMGGALSTALDAADQKLVDALQKRYGAAATKATIIPGGADDKPKGGGRNAAAAAALREAEAVLNLIDSLEFERSLIGMTDVQREKANALRQAGAAATDEQKARIEDLIDAIYRESEANEAAKESAQALADIGKDVLGGIISDLRSSASEAEIFANAIDKIADKLASMALDGLFDGLFKGGGGGFLSGIAKIFGFADGGIAAHGKPLPRFARGGVSRSAAIFGEAGPEAAVPLPDGRRIPVDLRIPMPALYNVRGPRPVTASRDVIDINLTDDSGRMAKIADRQIQTRSGTIVRVAVQQSQRATRANMPGFLAETQMRTM